MSTPSRLICLSGLTLSPAATRRFTVRTRWPAWSTSSSSATLTVSLSVAKAAQRRTRIAATTSSRGPSDATSRMAAATSRSRPNMPNPTRCISGTVTISPVHSAAAASSTPLNQLAASHLAPMVFSIRPSFAASATLRSAMVARLAHSIRQAVPLVGTCDFPRTAICSRTHRPCHMRRLAVATRSVDKARPCATPGSWPRALNGMTSTCCSTMTSATLSASMPKANMFASTPTRKASRASSRAASWAPLAATTPS